MMGPGRPAAEAGAWAICRIATLASVALFWTTGTAAAVAPLAVATAVILVLAVLHHVYTRLRPDPYIGPVAGGLAVILWAGVVAGMSALAALRTQAPLVDDALAQADTALGVDTLALVAWVARHPPASQLLDMAYLSALPLVFATMACLALQRAVGRMWELCFAFAGSVTVCAFASAFIPAEGLMVAHGMQPAILAALPPGAGRFHVPVFDAFRSGASATVDLRRLEGVVSFPSFHAAMALMTALAWRGSPRLRGPAWVWCGLILISTLPIGGHYLVDVIAGMAVCLAFSCLAWTPRFGPLDCRALSEGNQPTS